MFSRLTDKFYFDRLRYLEPVAACDNRKRDISTSHPRRKGSQCPMGTGMAVRTDDHIPRDHQTFFRKQCMLDPHVLFIKKVF